MSRQNGNPPDINLELDPLKDIVIKPMVVDGETKLRILAPMGDKIYCLGMLELAKQAILSFRPPAGQPNPQSGLVAAPASALGQIPAPDFQTGKRR